MIKQRKYFKKQQQYTASFTSSSKSATSQSYSISAVLRFHISMKNVAEKQNDGNMWWRLQMLKRKTNFKIKNQSVPNLPQYQTRVTPRLRPPTWQCHRGNNTHNQTGVTVTESWHVMLSQQWKSYQVKNSHQIKSKKSDSLFTLHVLSYYFYYF